MDTNALLESGNYEMLILYLRNKRTLNSEDIYKLLKSYYDSGEFVNGMKAADSFLEEVSPEDDRYIEIMYTAGDLYAVGVEFKKSITCYQEGLKYARERRKAKLIANGLMDLGNCYAEQGELLLSLDYINQSLSIFRDMNDFLGEAYARANIGYIKKDMGRFEEALLDLEFSEYYIKKYDKPVQYAILLKNILEVIGELDLDDKQREYFDKLKEISQVEKNERIAQVYKFAQALNYKSSPRLRDKARAVSIFKDIIEHEEYTPNKLTAIRHLCDIMLQEYRMFNDDDILSEISNYITMMHDIAIHKEIYPQIIGSLILKAKLSIILRDFTKAEHLFNEANSISIQKELGYYKKLVDEEIKRFNRDLIDMKNLVEGYADLVKHQAIDDIFDYLKSLSGNLEN